MGLTWIFQKCINEDPTKAVSFNENEGEFSPCQAPKINIQHNQMLERIKNHFNFKDARMYPQLQWWQSTRLNLFLYGRINRLRPIGNCFFYVMDPYLKQTPRCICTHISEQFVFSSLTLALFSDDSFYVGEMNTQIMGLPQAEGKGTLVFRDAIYEGQFKKGKPHGYGRYLSRFGELTGEFEAGLPQGEVVERTAMGLFVGTIDGGGLKQGTLVTPANDQLKVTDANQSAFYDQDIYSII